MSGDFSRAEFLSRARLAFNEALNVGRAFEKAHQLQRSNITCDAPFWGVYQAKVNAVWNALVQLRRPMQHPPAGTERVVDEVRKLERCARGILSEVRAGNFSVESYPDLLRIAEDGYAAVHDASPASTDSFARLDARKPTNTLGIDTTPESPRPPDQLIEAAARATPEAMANVQPTRGGQVEIVASHLAKRLQDKGHTLAAAQWAIHRLVLDGILTLKLIEMELPSYGREVGRGFGHLYGGPRTGHIEWSRGGTGTVGIPKGRPTPYDLFNVVSTESLWAWWREPHAPSDAVPNDEKKDSPPPLTISEPSRDVPQTSGAGSSDKLAGFLGGVDLANALDVHESRRDAFFKRLERGRKELELGDNDWLEAKSPPRNTPRFMYRADSGKVREMAADYKQPKST